MKTRSVERVGAAVFVLTVACAFAGCAAVVDSDGEHLADLIPIVEHGVSTDLILPPYGQSLDLLGRGWEVATPAFAREHGLWVFSIAGHDLDSIRADISGAGERKDIASVEPLLTRALLQRLLLQRHRNGLALAEQDQAPTEPLDEESFQRLRALGYLR